MSIVTVDENELAAVNTYYSHFSRLFVSNYATFFAVYLAFVALLLNVISTTEVPVKNGLFYLSFVIMAFELVVLYRALQFARVLNRIDELWKRNGILDVGRLFWPRDSTIGQLNWLYRKASVPLAVVLTICIPVLTWFLPLRMASPLTSEVGNTTITDWLTAIGTFGAVVLSLFLYVYLKLYSRPQLEIRFANEEPFRRTVPAQSRSDKVDAHFVRLEIHNKGRSVARGCEGKLVWIRSAVTNERRTDFDPAVLHWAGTPDSYDRPLDINRGEFEYLDVFFVRNDTNDRDIHICSLQRYRTAGITLDFPRGDYILHLVVYGANVREESKTYRLRIEGTAFDNLGLQELV